MEKLTSNLIHEMIADPLRTIVILPKDMKDYEEIGVRCLTPRQLELLGETDRARVKSFDTAGEDGRYRCEVAVKEIMQGFVADRNKRVVGIDLEPWNSTHKSECRRLNAEIEGLEMFLRRRGMS